jgi:hypothetical protein
VNLRSFALAALVPAGFLAVHDFGDYDHAPMCSTTSIEIDPGKVLSISDNAIHWRADLFAAVKAGTTPKQFFGGNAWRRKVAVAKVPCAMTLGGQAIAEGEWTLFAKVPGDDTSKFFLEWDQGDKKVDVPLAMKGGNDPEDHLLLALTPRGVEKESKNFELKVFYGDMKATVAGSFGAAQPATPPAKKN